MVVVGSMISTFFAPWLSTHQGTAVLCLLTRMIMKALWGYKKQLTLSLTNEADKKCENRDGKLQTLEATISSGWKIIPTVKISTYHFSHITKYQSRALFRISGFFRARFRVWKLWSARKPSSQKAKDFTIGCTTAFLSQFFRLKKLRLIMWPHWWAWSTK